MAEAKQGQSVEMLLVTKMMVLPALRERGQGYKLS